jgi:hypothetical protein
MAPLCYLHKQRYLSSYNFVFVDLLHVSQKIS